MMVGRAKPRSDVKQHYFLWTAKNDNVLVLPANLKRSLRIRFSVLGKTRLYSKDNFKILLVWRNLWTGLAVQESCSVPWRMNVKAFAIIRDSAAREGRKHHKILTLTKSSWTLGKNSLACFKVSHTCTITFLFPVSRLSAILSSQFIFTVISTVFYMYANETIHFNETF